MISGNSEYGIVDGGKETLVGNDSIGVDARGNPLPNGTAGVAGGGIRLAAGAEGPLIGIVGGSDEQTDTIAFNHGPGVLEESGVSAAQIRHGSIYANDGKGIAIAAEAPPAPTISAVGRGATTTTFKGTLSGTPAEFADLDFYASEACSPLDAGVGQTFLGEAREVLTANESPNPYEVTVPATIPAGGRFVTVTATPILGAFPTTEYSRCFDLAPPEPEPEPEPEQPGGEKAAPPSSPPPPAFVATLKGPTPTNGEKVVVAPEEGKVLIKLPGTKQVRAADRTEGNPGRRGDRRDQGQGDAHLDRRRRRRTDGGLLRRRLPGQAAGRARASSCSNCSTPSARRRRASRPGGRQLARPPPGKPATSGKLWGSGHGNFRTEGNDGSATVRGTIWLVEDRCDGTTFFKTRRGIVTRP